MSLSPHGCSAVVTGSLRKGLPIMMLGGVLAWVSGQSWSVEHGVGEAFQMLMAFGTLVAIAVPAQLVAGPRGRAWLMATMASLGISVPWFFGVAIEQDGQGMLLPTLIVLVSSWLVVFVVCWTTRRVLRTRVPH